MDAISDMRWVVFNASTTEGAVDVDVMWESKNKKQNKKVEPSPNKANLLRHMIPMGSDLIIVSYPPPMAKKSSKHAARVNDDDEAIMSVTGSSFAAEKGPTIVRPNPGKDSKSLVIFIDKKPTIPLLFKGSKTKNESGKGIYLSKIHTI